MQRSDEVGQDKCWTVGELAETLGLGLEGDAATVVDRVATLEDAGPGAVSFLANPRYRTQLGATRASAVVLSADAVSDCPAVALVSHNPYLAFARVAHLLNPPVEMDPGVHSQASVHPSASLGAGVRVEAAAVVDADARIADGAIIGAGAYVGSGARIGARSRVGPNVTLGARVVLGERVLLHPGVVIGADGFGFANDEGRWEKVPQLGGVRIGDDVEIGANTTVDRGALGDTVIEDGVKLDNLIQIGHNVRIGAHTAIAACTAVAGSVVIGKHCMIAGAVAIAGHLTIADGTFVTGMTMVSHSIREAGVYSGAIQMAPKRSWVKNAVRFQHLDDMFRRLRQLENELATLKRDLISK